MAVLSVPKVMATAQRTTCRSSASAPSGNFTNVELDVGPGVIVENIHFSDSLLALGYYLSESIDAKAAAEAGKDK